MINVETIEHKICDLCGKEVEKFAKCEECSPKVTLDIDVYYMGHRVAKDLCPSCNTKLYVLLYENFEELKHLPV